MQEIDIVSFSVSGSTGFCAVKFVNYLFFLGLPSESIHFALITAWAFIYLSQLMRLWLISHRGTGKAQASLCIHTVSPEPSLFAHMKYGSRRRVRPKIRHLALLDGCACGFEELSLRRTKSAVISWVGSFCLSRRDHYHMIKVMRKPVLCLCEQQRCWSACASTQFRSACASAQSDQHLCCSCLDSIIPLVSVSEISSL